MILSGSKFFFVGRYLSISSVSLIDGGIVKYFVFSCFGNLCFSWIMSILSNFFYCHKVFMKRQYSVFLNDCTLHVEKCPFIVLMIYTTLFPDLSC